MLLGKFSLGHSGFPFKLILDSIEVSGYVNVIAIRKNLHKINPSKWLNFINS